VRFTDTAGYFVSEASVYRLLKAHDLIASPAFIVMNERWHQTLKNRILLENYYLPGDLEAQIEAFVADYNHRRYHESIDNLTPADAYFGRGQTILLQRERIKRQTNTQRRLHHQRQAA
jgi:putative transposase